MKKITLLLLLTLSVFGLQAQTYQLNYDSIRVNKTAGTGGTSLYGKVYLKNVSARAAGDSILSVLNGRIFKVPYSAFVTSVTGTTNQITVTGTTTPTLSIPSAFIAPGSIRATTTMESGTTGTAGKISFRRSSDGAIASALEQFDTNTLLLTSNGGTRKLTVDANNIDFNSSSSSAQYNFGQNRPTATEVLINGSNNNKLRIQNNETDVITLNSNGGVVTAVTGTFSGNVTAANLASGTYTPTLTNGTNVSSSAINKDLFYIRTGNIVMFSVTIDVTPTAVGSTQVDFSLPIASNFSSITDAQATVSFYEGVGSVGTNFKVNSDSTNDRISVVYFTGTTGVISLVITGSYKVI